MPARKQKIGLFLGPAVLLAVILSPLPEGMSREAFNVAGVAVLMAVWWITEAVPIPVTALLPVALFPLLRVMKVSSATAPYANHLIFLFLGGFMIAVALEKWNLHRRIALRTIGLVGTGPRGIILGFMIATAFLSMWISNTATTMMMVPIGMAVIGHVAGDTPHYRYRFGTALMLGIAYAASIGGVATLIGTPPNVILAGFVESTYGREISFLSWLSFGLPLAVVMLTLTWLYLTRLAFQVEMESIPGGKELVRGELDEMGGMTTPEKRVLAVFLLVAASWIVRGFLPEGPRAWISDSTIAVTGAIFLFLVPSGSKEGGFLLDWDAAGRIPWGVIILFGGGLSLAGAFSGSGLDRWIGSRLMILENVNYLVMISAIVLMTVFLTEVTSNTATSAMLIPVAASIAISMSIHPYGLIVAAGVSASYAFMLPVATPPNAIVFCSRQVTIPQMVRAGFALNLISWIMITLFISVLLPLLWKIDLGSAAGWL